MSVVYPVVRFALFACNVPSGMKRVASSMVRTKKAYQQYLF